MRKELHKTFEKFNLRFTAEANFRCHFRPQQWKIQAL
jgi:hypothetical protein